MRTKMFNLSNFRNERFCITLTFCVTQGENKISASIDFVFNMQVDNDFVERVDELNYSHLLSLHTDNHHGRWEYLLNGATSTIDGLSSGFIDAVLRGDDECIFTVIENTFDVVL